MSGTYQTLTQPKPWYSRYGGDLFNFSVYSSNTLGAAQMGTAGIRATAHILGQRHYELTNHLGNVQATVLDRVTPAFVKGPSGSDELTGYRADISTAQDYYPFGMLMPGRYISDTSRHCVTTTQTMMVQKPIELYPYPGDVTVRAWQFGVDAPTIGSLPVAGSFTDEALHVYHYLGATQHPNNWVAQATAAGGGGYDYAVDLSGEPSGISSYLHLHLDTSVTSQSLTFGLVLDRNKEVMAEVRVRQYAAGSSEEYEELVGWKQVEGSAELSVPVWKWAVAAGGKTVAEWRFSTRDGKSFGNDVAISVRRPVLGRVQWVAENRVVTTCEERDNYRFGFNGQEKVNEVAGVGNHNTALFWEYDTRLGRRWNLDPRPVVFQSPYAAFNNNPLWYSDILGDTTAAGTWMRNNLPGLVAAPLGGLTDAIGGTGLSLAKLIKGDNEGARKEIHDAGVGLLSTVGLADAFTRDWVDGETGGRLPESLADEMVNVKDKVWSGYVDAPDKNGMHAWHAGSNAVLTQQLGPVGAIFVFIGGLFHESPLDRGFFRAEQRAQGTVNHILDSFSDIIANVFGMTVGLVLPKQAAMNVSIKAGNWIPGLGDPDPHGKGTGGYTGNPVDAWGQYPKK